VPIRAVASKLTATPTPMQSGGFSIAEEYNSLGQMDELAPISAGGDLPDIKPEDRPYFEKILNEGASMCCVSRNDCLLIVLLLLLLLDEDDDLTPEEERERRIMRLLLKIKNGTPQMRKQAMRQITDKAREFGAAALFNQILPLLRSATLEDQERHLLVKVIDRILYKLDDRVRPFVHKILVVIEVRRRQ
jgi:splicing factor 3B subunit 1